MSLIGHCSLIFDRTKYVGHTENVQKMRNLIEGLKYIDAIEVPKIALFHGPTGCFGIFLNLFFSIMLNYCNRNKLYLILIF